MTLKLKTAWSYLHSSGQNTRMCRTDRRTEFLWLLQRFALRLMRTRCKNCVPISRERRSARKPSATLSYAKCKSTCPQHDRARNQELKDDNFSWFHDLISSMGLPWRINVLTPSYIDFWSAGFSFCANTHTDKLTSSSAIAEWPLYRVGQFWPKVEHDILQTI